MSRNKTLVVIVVVILVSIIGLAFYLFIISTKQLSNSGTQDIEPRYPIAHLSEAIPGRIYLTLQATVGDVLEPTLYQIDSKTGMNRSWLDLTAITERPHPIVRKGSSTFVAYPGSIFQNEYQLPSGVMQVMVSDEAGIIRPLTKSLTNRKLSPSWSPDGQRIAFMASTSPTAIPRAAPEVWDIYVTDLFGNENFVTKGAYPQWSSEGGSLYVLKESGIAQIDISSGGEKLVYESAGPLDWYAKISSNHSGTLFLLTEPFRDEISVLEVEGEKLTKKSTIYTNAVSAVISPDNKMVAILHVPVGGSDPHLSIISIDSGQIIETRRLEYFSDSFLLLTDWVSE